MYQCLDCGSGNIVDVAIYQGYFREGDMCRLRHISVWNNINGEPKGYLASCKELSLTAVSLGESELNAIANLGEILHKMLGVELLGKRINDDDE